MTLAGATSIAKISLDSARVDLIDVPAPAIALALGAATTLFARLDDGFGVDAPISTIDAVERSVLATRRADFGELIAFHRPTNRLLAGSKYGGLTAFEYAPQTMVFTEAESSADTSYPCRELGLSPKYSLRPTVGPEPRSEVAHSQGAVVMSSVLRGWRARVLSSFVEPLPSVDTATYEDLGRAPRHLVAEILNGDLGSG